MTEDRILLIDGYNIIGAWKEVRMFTLDHARERLIHRVEDYTGATGMPAVIVFDGHHVKNNQGSEEDRGPLKIVFTGSDQTADAYIERICALYRREGVQVSVATGDGMEQSIVLGLGALRIPPRELLQEMERMREASRRYYGNAQEKSMLFNRLDEKVAERLEQIRRN